MKPGFEVLVGASARGCTRRGEGNPPKNTKRRERLMEKGFSDTELKRLNAPAGIDIGSKTPAEIAVSILAQLIKSRRSLEH